MGDLKPVTPLLELLLELHDPEMVFVPSIYIEDPDGFFRLLQNLLEDIVSMGYHMERVYKQAEASHYFDDMQNNYHVKELFNEVLSRAASCAELAVDYVKKFEEYSYLWLEDRQEFLSQFLLYGRQLSPDEADLVKDEQRASEVKESPPTIDQFKEQIDFYEDLYKKLELIEQETIITGGWLRIDVRPFRQAVLNTVCKWGNLFKQHLYNRVIDSLNELETFIGEAISAMQVTLEDDDYEGLLNVMGYLFKVKERQLATDYMFEPLKQIMDLLKEYGVDFPEEVYVQLQEAPDKWTQCKKVSVLKFRMVIFVQTDSSNLLYVARRKLRHTLFFHSPLMLLFVRSMFLGGFDDETNRSSATSQPSERDQKTDRPLRYTTIHV